jgi:hypothetical protein
MATGDIKQVTPASVALTISLASLAADTNLLIGRSSTVFDNSATLYLDAFLAGKIKVNATVVSGGRIEVWAFGNLDDVPTYPDGIGGTDAAKTISSLAVKRSGLKLVQSIEIDGTGSATYPFGPVAVSQLFGGAMPDKLGVFVTHNTGNPLDSTGSNHAVNIIPVYLNVAP